ncbi:MAG: hypothetical protein K8E24_001905 [Methanobacterium paludis]|nr:hypothetical protein [Methanobacterium paludis]
MDFTNIYFGKMIYDNVLAIPTSYEYTEGKYWDLLSYFEFDEEYKQFLLDSAIKRLSSIDHSYSLKLGLYKFLCSEDTGLVFEYLKNENSDLIQMMIMPYIPEIEEKYEKLLPILINNSSYEPGLIAVNNIISKNKLYMITKMGLPKNDPTCVIENCLGKPNNMDSIGQIIHETYGIPYCDKWKKLLGSEYEHANLLLSDACDAYNIDGNIWINYKDTFNEMLIRNFIPLINSKRPEIKWPKVSSINGKRVDYGTILDKNNQLYKKYHRIIKPFRNLHLRRNETPTSHAYVKRSNKLASFVNSKEKKEHFEELKKGYSSLIKEIEKFL